MEEVSSKVIAIELLQTGMYVELELGWMAHPFPTGSFKITTKRQIEIIQGLGLRQVRYVPAKSDPPPSTLAEAPLQGTDPASPHNDTAAQRAAQEQLLRRQRADALAAQQRDLAVCERRFGQTVRQYKQVLEQVHSKPREVMAQCQTLVDSFVGDMQCNGETAIRLLSDGMGDKLAMHPVNVSIISLLLGKQLGLAAPDLADLGAADL